jgi:hypothetical protein
MKAKRHTKLINLNELGFLNSVKEKKKGIELSPIVKDAQNTRLLLFPTEEKKHPRTEIRKRKINFLSNLCLLSKSFDFKKLK